MSSNTEYRIPSLIEGERVKLEKSIDKLKAEFSSIGFQYKQTDTVIKSIKNLMTETQNSIDFLLKNTVTQPEKIVKDILGYAIKVLDGIDSQYKRLKKMEKSKKFVEPQEKSSGYKIKRVFDETAGCVVSKSVQTTFQFIPPSETLAALFNSPDFEKTYMDYNKNKDHNCEPSTYINFCCGETYKSKEFFEQNPLAIQIRLFTDDFEPCDPLKSKSGVHKITAFYFQIGNLPAKLLSKTDNIYLVALSDASDSKNDLADVDVVLQTILLDFKSLETKGIITGYGTVLKAGLIGVIFDNLGGNNLFAFSGGFNANYYCRICISTRNDCQQMVKEDPATIRTREEYDEIVALIESGASPSLTESKGIKSACCLNTLNHFHILSNVSVDLMHDVFEGTAGFLMEQVFNYCKRENIATIEHLQTLVECFYYGQLWKDKKPSKLKIEKKNIGQNASQALCIILHLPFILFQFKDQLKPIWLAVESMLQIIQILLSDQINEADLERLSEMITTHLQCYQLYFNQPLKPKHHFLLHYVRVIRLMGPVIRFWALRMEAKHQFFKRIVHNTKNFINIKKTLAYKHQQHFFDTPFPLEDDVSFGKSTPFTECMDFGIYIDELRESFLDDLIQNAQTAKSLRVNNRLYKSGILVVSGKQFYKIGYILSIQNEILFLCNECYDILVYESSLNSLHVESKKEIAILNLRSLENSKPYEIQYVGIKSYVIADCLAIYKMYSN